MDDSVFSFSFALDIVPLLLRAAVITVEATLGSFALAASLGLVIALLGRFSSRLMAAIVGAVTDFIRGTPLLLQLYVAYFLLPGTGLVIGALATGILVMGVHFSCFMAEVYRAGIEAVPRGQLQAAAALGLRPMPIMRLIVLPQAIPPIIPPLGNYLISMFKETPLLSAITVTELLMRAKLIGAETFRYFEAMTLVGLIFLAVSLVASQAVQALERRLSAARVGA